MAFRWRAGLRCQFVLCWETPEIVTNGWNRRFFIPFLLFSIVIPQGLLRSCCLSLSAVIAVATVASGAHCPLMHQSSRSEKKNTHHCPMYNQDGHRQRQELRCDCCPFSTLTFSSEISIVRFLLPHRITAEMPPNETQLSVSCVFPIPLVALAPPDPPPRAFQLLF